MSPIEAIRRASARRQMVQDWRPMADALEWTLSSLCWLREGVQPFVNDLVPYQVNNNGRASADAAAMLMASCRERPGPVRVLELGAGTGLFARYFLDEFRTLCEQEHEDFYERLTYSITDGSPRTVERWQELGVFATHAGHVEACVCDATSESWSVAGPFRAAFGNYVMDSLPSAVVRWSRDRWEQLYVRTWIADDPDLLRQYLPLLTYDEIRACAASTDPEQLARLLKLMPLLEFDLAFAPAADGLAARLDALGTGKDGEPFPYNYGALACLDRVFERMAADGFVLVHDFGPVKSEELNRLLLTERYGSTVVQTVNFPLLEEHGRRAGFEVVGADAISARALHARLFLREPACGARQVFEAARSARVQQRAEAALAQAHREVEKGRTREALAAYRAAIELNPRDWQLLGEAAVFVSTQLHDLETGLQLARTAVELNPWYCPLLWSVMGDCLMAMERVDEAHECYLQAQRIDPKDVKASLSLAQSWLRRNDPAQSLEAVARGLAHDSNGLFREQLLEMQQQAMAALAGRWNAERGVAARR